MEHGEGKHLSALHCIVVRLSLKGVNDSHVPSDEA